MKASFLVNPVNKNIVKIKIEGNREMHEFFIN